MKILIIHWGSQYLLGGVERFVQQCAESLSKTKHKVSTIGITNKKLEPNVELSGDFHGIPFMCIHRHQKKFYLESFFSLLAAPFALDTDVVFSQGMQGIHASFFSPVVMFDHGPFGWQKKHESKRYLSYRTAKKVIVGTQIGCDTVQRTFPKYKEKLEVVPIGTYMPEGVKLLTHAPRHVLSVGRLDEERKGMHLVIPAFRKVVERFKDAQLTLVGSGEREPCERLIRQNHLQDCVTILNKEGSNISESELDEAYRSAELFVSASRRETFGIVLIEAMSYGLPIVATYSESIPSTVGELIVGNDVGLIGPVNDVEGLANNIIHLMEDGELAQRFSFCARKIAETKYNWPVLIDRYIDIFSKAQENN